MKVKFLTILLLALISMSSDSLALFGWLRNKPGVGQASRENIISRAFRSAGNTVTTACSSAKGGFLPLFELCLISELAKKNLDPNKISDVLVVDKSGNPKIVPIARQTFKQTLFNQWLALSQTSTKLIDRYSELNGKFNELQNEQEQDQDQDGAKDNTTRIELTQEMLTEIQTEFTDVWNRYNAILEQLDQAEQQGPSDQKDISLFPIPEPDATDPMFSPEEPINGPQMSTNFRDALYDVIGRNRSIMSNFCHNFCEIGGNAGWEDAYVRMGETGKPTPDDIKKYQNQKAALIGARCSDPSIDGLKFRALCSKCPSEMTGTPIAACSGMGDSEFGSPQTTR